MEKYPYHYYPYPYPHPYPYLVLLISLGDLSLGKISSLLQDFNDDDFDKVLESYKVVDIVHDECDKIFGVLMLCRR